MCIVNLQEVGRQVCVCMDTRWEGSNNNELRGPPLAPTPAPRREFLKNLQLCRQSEKKCNFLIYSFGQDMRSPAHGLWISHSIHQELRGLFERCPAGENILLK